MSQKYIETKEYKLGIEMNAMSFWNGTDYTRFSTLQTITTPKPFLVRHDHHPALAGFHQMNLLFFADNQAQARDIFIEMVEFARFNLNQAIINITADMMYQTAEIWYELNPPYQIFLSALNEDLQKVALIEEALARGEIYPQPLDYFQPYSVKNYQHRSM